MFAKRFTIIYLVVLVLISSMPPQNILAAEVGYEDGCSTGHFVAGDNTSSWKKDYKLFSSNEKYKKGWEAGFFDCLGYLAETEKTQQAVLLANFDNEVASAELTAYFSMPEHKAFALNPLNRGNYYWLKEKSSEEEAIKMILKRGPQCILFAVDDEIVWEEELDQWEKEHIEENFSQKLDTDNNTILHYVAYYENLPYLERLITNGADVTIKNKKGQTAEDFAQMRKNEATIEMLKNAKKK
ncbi:ankyrin repeat domain-containing protein [Candidatus Gracilibacteria bacterium]|nr:ankyrin repeat domain-containing protein [Candidatus Gracilibacteria bacterium]MCF7856550.1 ankyrin repeat domain-containing protein [Candidatus Gracilibacteria bacterium]MCF7896839.1 ankyrin repeat domain-containing protein [Candidatus Gracilibacteria bacterium]